MGSLFRNARLVVSSFGYNSAVQILSTRTRALVIPLDPPGDWEQMLRASSFERLGVIKTLRLNALSNESFANELEAALEYDKKQIALDFNGAKNTSDMLENLLKAS